MYLSVLRKYDRYRITKATNVPRQDSELQVTPAHSNPNNIETVVKE